METIIGTVNGVDVKRLKDTTVLVQSQPELGLFRFRAKNQWINGSKNRTSIKEFFGAGAEDTTRTDAFIYDNDEPEILLGADSAPNPVEYILHALAGCLTTSLVYHASARGYEIDKVESTLEGDLDLKGFLGIDPDARRGYENIRVSFKIEGDFTNEQKKEILKLGERFSPVFDILTNKVNVQLSLVD